MIASRKHGFIFVKTRKTGGTSIEIVLSAWCGPHDICSPITEEDERIRESLGGSARNYRGFLGRRKFYNHMPARDIARELPTLWRSAFKFTVERSPYEKVISRAYWRIGIRGGQPEVELQDEIDSIIAGKTYLNYPLYTINGAVCVDEIIRYEEIDTALRRLSERFGTVLPSAIPKAKGQYRSDRRLAVEILTEGQRKRIAADAAFEFELLGYTR